MFVAHDESLLRLERKHAFWFSLELCWQFQIKSIHSSVLEVDRELPQGPQEDPRHMGAKTLEISSIEISFRYENTMDCTKMNIGFLAKEKV